MTEMWGDYKRSRKIWRKCGCENGSSDYGKSRKRSWNIVSVFWRNHTSRQPEAVNGSRADQTEWNHWDQHSRRTDQRHPEPEGWTDFVFPIVEDNITIKGANGKDSQVVITSSYMTSATEGGLEMAEFHHCIGYRSWGHESGSFIKGAVKYQDEDEGKDNNNSGNGRVR